MEAATITQQLESFNPATGERIGAVPITAPDEVAGVVSDVAQVQPFWSQLTLADRARYLERASQVLIDESDDIRDLLVREQGKPRNEAFSMEILPTIDALQWIGRAGMEILADEKIPMPQLFLKTKRSAFTYEPLGVIGIISPWNYPWSIPFGEVAIALDGRQRRRFEAGVADATDRRADPQGVRTRRRARGSRPRRPRTRHGLRAGEVRRGEGVLHRIGRGRPWRR